MFVPHKEIDVEREMRTAHRSEISACLRDLAERMAHGDRELMAEAMVEAAAYAIGEMGGESYHSDQKRRGNKFTALDEYVSGWGYVFHSIGLDVARRIRDSMMIARGRLN